MEHMFIQHGEKVEKGDARRWKDAAQFSEGNDKGVYKREAGLGGDI